MLVCLLPPVAHTRLVAPTCKHAHTRACSCIGLCPACAAVYIAPEWKATHLCLPHGQLAASSNRQLPLHQVHTSNCLAHGVLNL